MSTKKFILGFILAIVGFLAVPLIVIYLLNNGILF